MDEHVYPNEATYNDQLAGAADRWQPVPIVQELKQKAKARACGTCSWPTASAAPG